MHEMFPTPSLKKDPSSILIDTVQRLSLARTLPQVIEITKHAAREITGADGATFVLRENDMCSYVDEDAIAPLWKGNKFAIDICVSGWAMTHKEPVVIPDIETDSRIPLDIYKLTFVRSLVIVPIRKESPIGAIGNYWASKHTATKEEVSLLQALADTVSVALENVQLYASLEQRVTELDAANRAKDRFLTLLSHELRTPLNLIYGWSEMLAEDLVDPAERQAAADTIRTHAKAQLKMVNELIDSANIVAGSLQLDSKPVNLPRIVERAVTAAKPEAVKRSILLTTKGLERFHGSVIGEEARIEQVLANLLENAIKFTPKGGKVEVELIMAGPSARIDVTDNGDGMEPEFVPSLFKRFRKEDDSLTRLHGGLGIGLAIARSLVEAHGGSIIAASEGRGKGAKFSVFLPLHLHKSAIA